MMNDEILMASARSGTRSTLVARKPDRRKHKIERMLPRRSSTNRPERRILFASAYLPLEVYSAMYFVIAEFTPQSRRIAMKFGAIQAIATRPYWEGLRSLAIHIVPAVEMIADIINPQKT